MAVVLLQGSATAGVGLAALYTHAPAVAAVVPALDQHVQPPQPATRSAPEAQQQPARHRSVPQSALAAHASPGECSRQVPVFARHVAQPCRAALGVQQKPPRQAPEAQPPWAAQGAPAGAWEGEGVGAAAAGVGVGVEEGVIELLVPLGAD